MTPAIRRIAIDALIAVVVAAVVAVAIRVADEPGARPPDARAYAIGAVIGLLLVFRRRWPLLVLVGSVTALMIYYALEYPGIPPALPLAAALFSVAAAGRFTWALVVAGFFVVLELIMRYTLLGEGFFPALSATLEEGSLLAAVVLLAETIRTRRIRLAEAQQRLAVMRQERQHEVAQERLRIAREVHDVLGHTIAAISVQASLADDIFDSKPAEARAALRSIRGAARDAMHEVRSAIGMLRDAGEVPDLARVFAVAEQAGVKVRSGVAGIPRPIPPEVALSVYRIVQESITNTVKHAEATTVDVTITYAGDAVTVEVVDDGVGAAASRRGHGVAGMRERATAAGGSLDAGPRPEGGGFRVAARLPVEVEETA
ncbi:sensor histidine kinase [Micromonospora sp. M51]|uniref:histidine kinase n=1 Tax=Micromonospora parva TaxID=1464048 RepID=A0ABW6VW67_9ACTN|nr:MULTISPECIES: sensor histidine kinase [Micromonospora]MBQ1013489.1 sensor histidine kinase [Micromonospora sp. M51]MBQ1033190.1 sensor histidine kinase [Micromonospora sp. C97]